MRVALVLDNNVSRAHTHPFELIASREKDLSFTVFVGEKNKGDVSAITLEKRFLSHRKEALYAMASPVDAAKRLKENRLPRMDFYYFSLKRELAGFDAVYTQDITRSLYTLASLKDRLGFRLIVRWWENLPYKRLFSEKDSVIAERSLGKVDLFLPATAAAGEALRLEGTDEKKITQIYPGVDTERFSPSDGAVARERYGIPAGRIAVLFAGRLVSHKGLFTILCAAKELERTGRLGRFAFVIAGSGGRRDEMERMAGAMGVRSAFIFLGAVPYGSIQEVYRAADIFILPSTMKENIQEQFGLVLAEAMACGTPVIGSNIGAIPEVIGDAGVIVPPGDFKSLAEAVRLLGEDAGKREESGKKARQRAVALFSSVKNADKLLKALRSFG